MYAEGGEKWLCRYPRLKRHGLIKRAQDGVQEAFESLLKEHRGRIRGMAARRRIPGIVGADDLYSEGCIGFLEAIRRFCLGWDVLLWTFAQWKVMNRMTQWRKRVLRLRKGDGGEDEDRLTGVVLSDSVTPEDAVSLSRGEYFQVVLECLRSDADLEAGQKWSVLYLLCECGYEWSEIAALLMHPDADLASAWADLCHQCSLPTVVPRDWAVVYKLFWEPPPKLTAGALRQWYHRGPDKIRPKWHR